MIQYRKILEYYFNGISQRTIETSVGSSRHTIRSVIQDDYCIPSCPLVRSRRPLNADNKSTECG